MGLHPPVKLTVTMRAMISRVRATRSAREVTVNYGLLCRALRKKAMVAWLRTLPMGEAAAYERLCALHAEWIKRPGDELAAPVDERMVERAYRVADRAAQRILRVGRYLVKGDPARKGDYAAFKAPARRRAAKSATKPAPPQPPTG